MWFFNTKKKGRRTLKKEENSTPLITQTIEHHGIKELNVNDAVLRFWLPEEGKLALDEVVKCNQTTGARYLRELFVVYLYGEHELHKMKQQSIGLYYEPPPPPREVSEPDSDVRFSVALPPPTVDVVPELGKSIVPVKLYLPEKIKDDLQEVANKADIPLSTFIREIMISHLFGHTYWQERLRSWSPAEEAIGNKWEGDDEGQFTVKLDKGDWEDQGSERPPKIVEL